MSGIYVYKYNIQIWKLLLITRSGIYVYKYKFMYTNIIRKYAKSFLITMSTWAVFMYR